MQRPLTAILGVLVLFLLAANVRLEERRAALERTVVALESRNRPKRPAPAQPMAAAETPGPVAKAPATGAREPLPTATPAPAPKTPAPGPAAAAAPALLNAEGNVVHALTGLTGVTPTWTFVSKPANGDEALGLSADQKAAIEELRRIRDLQTNKYQEDIQSIEERTETAIRQVLRPDQLQMYDAQNKVVDVVTETAQIDPPPASRGYLGVSGADADGGGVRLSQVLPKTAAEEIGLKVGDVILEVNGEKIQNYGDLATKIQGNTQGTAVILRLRRDGTEFFQVATLGPRN
jgi:membrane-associated protease RseP (regulator of RpoE activity)